MAKRIFEDFTKSPFYDVHSDFMNALTHAKIFNVETLQDPEFHFTKTRIIYERLFDEQALSCDAPEIDTVTFTSVYKLFLELQKRGYKSKLIDHFAELESMNLELKDPYTTNVLLKRTRVLTSMCAPRKGAESETLKSKSETLKSKVETFNAESEILSADSETFNAEMVKEKRKKEISKMFDNIIGESNHPPDESESLEFVDDSFALEKCYYSYRVCGNNFTFQRMRKLDPDFWPLMLKASLEESLLSFSELDLAVDFNFNLLKYVETSIQRGHYEFKGLKPKGYFYLAGHFYESNPLGKRTQAFQQLQDKEFKIETLYIGHKKNNAVSFIFYDKKADLLHRKNEYSPEKTRIELRLNFKRNVNITPDARVSHWLAYNLVRSYAYGSQGVGFRLIAMMVFLTGYVRFSNHFNNLGEADIAKSI